MSGYSYRFWVGALVTAVCSAAALGQDRLVVNVDDQVPYSTDSTITINASTPAGEGGVGKRYAGKDGRPTINYIGQEYVYKFTTTTQMNVKITRQSQTGASHTYILMAGDEVGEHTYRGFQYSDVVSPSARNSSFSNNWNARWSTIDHTYDFGSMPAGTYYLVLEESVSWSAPVPVGGDVVFDLQLTAEQGPTITGDLGLIDIAAAGGPVVINRSNPATPSSATGNFNTIRVGYSSFYLYEAGADIYTFSVNNPATLNLNINSQGEGELNYFIVSAPTVIVPDYGYDLNSRVALIDGQQINFGFSGDYEDILLPGDYLFVVTEFTGGGILGSSYDIDLTFKDPVYTDCGVDTGPTIDFDLTATPLTQGSHDFSGSTVGEPDEICAYRQNPYTTFLWSQYKDGEHIYAFTVDQTYDIVSFENNEGFGVNDDNDLLILTSLDYTVDYDIENNGLSKGEVADRAPKRFTQPYGQSYGTKFYPGTTYYLVLDGDEEGGGFYDFTMTLDRTLPKPPRTFDPESPDVIDLGEVCDDTTPILIDFCSGTTMTTNFGLFYDDGSLAMANFGTGCSNGNTNGASGEKRLYSGTYYLAVAPARTYFGNRYTASLGSTSRLNPGGVYGGSVGNVTIPTTTMPDNGRHIYKFTVGDTGEFPPTPGGEELIDLGIIMTADETIDISTCENNNDTEPDTEIAVYDVDGRLLESNDNFYSNCARYTGPSRIPDLSLERGTYFICIGTYDMTFGVRSFDVSFRDSIYSTYVSTNITIGDEVVEYEFTEDAPYQWVCFTVAESSGCNLADRDADFDNDIFDAMQLLTDFDEEQFPFIAPPFNTGPAANEADLDGDGDNDINDILAFVNVFDEEACGAVEE